METSNHQHQAMATSPLEEVLCCPTLQAQQQQTKRKPRPPPEQALSCPRCNSTNTKFCYYNNYSLSQPRYFCKGRGRYWTKGGTLRNVPVGGGCRKNKRSSSSKKTQCQNLPAGFDALLPSFPPPLPLVFDPHDLTLVFSTLYKEPGLNGHGDLALGNTSTSPVPPEAPGFLDVLRMDSSTAARAPSMTYITDLAATTEMGKRWKVLQGESGRCRRPSRDWVVQHHSPNRRLLARALRMGIAADCSWGCNGRSVEMESWWSIQPGEITGMALVLVGMVWLIVP